MSIKGTSQELYVGKKESNIISFWGNKKKIDYEDLKRIEFSYAGAIDSGYLKFVHNSNKVTRFEFGKKVNDKIGKTIELIEENNPELIISEHKIDDLRFHQRWWFAILMMFCCCYPIGLFFMWHNGKFTRFIRITITLLTLFLFVSGIYRYISTISDISNMYNQANASIVNETYASSVDDASNDTLQKEEAYTTTLITGHYVVGIDIPVGTYNFYSKKGSGNLISSDGTVNVIFDHDKESSQSMGIDFGTEELNNIFLERNVIITVTGNQQISAGCDDGLVEAMENRNQEDLKEIEIGYGNFGASDNIPAGTYDVELVEGTGNIICSSSIDFGINEIMGESSNTDLDKMHIKKFRNLILNDGDILEINDIKIKLTPSK